MTGLDERGVAFLMRLASLSRETGVWINGCGECGSPWLNTPDFKELDEFEVVRPNDSYTGYVIGNGHVTVAEFFPDRWALAPTWEQLYGDAAAADQSRGTHAESAAESDQ